MADKKFPRPREDEDFPGWDELFENDELFFSDLEQMGLGPEYLGGEKTEDGRKYAKWLRKRRKQP